MSVTGILAAGMVLVIVTAQIDLSVGSTAAFFGGLLAVLQVQHGWDPSSALVVTLLAGTVVGAFQGYLTSYKGIPSFIVTLGGMMSFRGASMWITQSSTIPLPENWLLAAGAAYVSASSGWVLTIIVLVTVNALLIRSWWKHSKLDPAQYPLSNLISTAGVFSFLILGAMWVFSAHEGIPVPVLLMLGIVVLLDFLATRTVWGRHVFAIGGNPEAAFLSGVPVKFRLLTVFATIGTLSALAGAVLTSRVGSASPDAGQLLELDAIASCVIGGTSLMGGKGNVFGAILGALMIESLNNGMSLANMEPYWQYVIKGLVLIGAVWVDIKFRKD
jgi:D-xylose transport system permease protein